LVLAKLGFIPRGGESFDYAGYRFTVLEMERHRVARIKLQRWIAATPAPRMERQSAQPKSPALPQP
jgi:CBS domain containing-hemolysin-like protein